MIGEAAPQAFTGEETNERDLRCAQNRSAVGRSYAKLIRSAWIGVLHACIIP